MNHLDWNDQRIELIIGNLLRTGVALAGIVVFLGGAIYLARHGSERIDYRTFVPELGNLRSPSGVLNGVANFSGRAIIQLGLLLLIATPVARVVFSAIAFAMERDYLYVTLTLVVMAVLAYSLVGHALR